MTKPRVLLIAYAFPPVGLVGVHRTVQLAKYLPEAGYDVTVLTTDGKRAPIIDETLLAQIPKSVKVVRTPDYAPTLRRTKKSSTKEEAFSSTEQGIPNILRTALRQAGDFFLRPDPNRTWQPWALRAASRILQNTPCDLIIVSAPPFSSFLIGHDLHKRSGLPLVLDFRDQWTRYPFYNPPTGIHRLIDRYWERAVVGSAAAIITTSEPTSESIRQLHHRAQDVYTIPNGFDPAEFAMLKPQRSSGRLRLVHTGSFHANRDLQPLLTLLDTLFDQNPALAKRWEVIFMGDMNEPNRALLAQARFSKNYQYKPFANHQAALQEQLNSDALLLAIPTRAHSEGWIPAKLFEYLRAGRPIFALAEPENAAAQIVKKTHSGVIGSFHNPVSAVPTLAALLEKIQNNSLHFAPLSEDIAYYDRKVQVKAFAQIFDTVRGVS